MKKVGLILVVLLLLLLQAFLSILCAMKWGTFLFFAGWVLIMTIFVILCVPETKVRGAAQRIGVLGALQRTQYKWPAAAGSKWSSATCCYHHPVFQRYQATSIEAAATLGLQKAQPDLGGRPIPNGWTLVACMQLL